MPEEDAPHGAIIEVGEAVDILAKRCARGKRKPRLVHYAACKKSL